MQSILSRRRLFGTGLAVASLAVLLLAGVSMAQRGRRFVDPYDRFGVPDYLLLSVCLHLLPAARSFRCFEMEQ